MLVRISFSFSFTKISFLAIENNGADMGCLDELLFMGEDSSFTTPFASCQFNQIWFDSSKVQRQKDKGSFTSWMPFKSSPVECKFSSAETNSLQQIIIKLCEIGQENKLAIEFRNERDDSCKTDSLVTDGQNSLYEFTVGNFDKSGNKCKNFDITKVTYAKVINLNPDSDNHLCITKLHLDIVNQQGDCTIKVCKLNLHSYFTKDQSIPVVCR